MPNLKVGIVGLPNVGKSTLFNLLTQSDVDASNYPFCTIDPNIGIVKVEDNRLLKLNEIVKSQKIVPAVVEFVDIAGLVKGAHNGEGLGNKFLSNIKEVSIIVHVVRGFVDVNVTHVNQKVDPLSDIETIEMELILKDLESVESVISKIERKAKTDRDLKVYLNMLIKLRFHLESQKMAINFNWDKQFSHYRKELGLLTDKKIIYLINTDQQMPIDLERFLKDKDFFVIDLKIANEIQNLSKDELEELFGKKSEQFDINRLISKCYKSLNLISFFTAGEKEVKAWTIQKGITAIEGAGVIHTDFSKNFIAVEVVGFDDFVKYNGWLGAREKGKVRLEGRDYVIQDGDVLIFRHGA